MRSGEFSFFQDIYGANDWHLHFPKAYNHKNWTAGRFRGVKSLKTNQAGTLSC